MLVGHESVDILSSPYTRAKQTAEIIIEELNKYRDTIEKANITYREDPRLREQDFGNLQYSTEINICRAERDYCGAFYYRFPQGESGCDVYDRVASFLDSLHTSFENDTVAPNILLMTHGMTLRLLLMKYFRWSVDKFHHLWNPENCQIICLERVEMDEILNQDSKAEYFPYKLLTPLREDNIVPPNKPKSILQRLFYRKWGCSNGATPFEQLDDDAIKYWIKQQHLEWEYTEHQYIYPNTIFENFNTNIQTKILPIEKSSTIKRHSICNMENQQPTGPLNINSVIKTSKIKNLGRTLHGIDKPLQNLTDIQYSKKNISDSSIVPMSFSILSSLNEVLNSISFLLHTVETMHNTVDSIYKVLNNYKDTTERKSN